MLNLKTLPGQLLPDGYYSYGVHPWQFDQATDTNLELEKLEHALQDNKLAVIGETGLDRLHRHTLTAQLASFEAHILLSEHYRKPLVIHLVKATGELLQLHKRHHPQQPWIIHGFNGNKEEVQQLLELDICLSVGESILFPNRKINASLPSIPLDHLFLETDTGKTPIEDIYKSAASSLGVPLQTLKENVFTNFERLHLTPWKTGKNAPDGLSVTKELNG